MSNSRFWSPEHLATLPVEGIQNGPTFYPLPAASILKIQGPDAVRFMQGQFTCDVDKLAVSSSQLGACCTQKGRMLALFRIARLTEDCFLIRLPALIATNLMEHLQKYKVFFKCDLTLLSDWGVTGLVGDTAIMATSLGSLPETTQQVAYDKQTQRLVTKVSSDPDRWEIWASAEYRETWMPTLLENGCAKDAASWELLEIKSGYPEVMPATQEEFIPQMLNLQALGGVSFKKGCYTGQEIVARMQYLGKLKKRMYLMALTPAGDLPAPGDPVVDKENKRVGTVVRSSFATEDQAYALCVVENALVDSNTALYLEDTQTALHPHPLPYQVEGTGQQRPA